MASNAPISSPGLLAPHFAIAMVFMYIWKALAEAWPKLPITDLLALKSTDLIKDPGYHVLCYFLDHAADVISTNTMPPENKIFGTAITMQHLCDFFCAVVTKALGKKLKEIVGPDIKMSWFQFTFNPLFVMIENISEEYLLLSPHTAIEIELPNGEIFIFDGTTDQYGRPFQTHAYITKEEHSREHVRPGSKTPWDLGKNYVDHTFGWIKEVGLGFFEMGRILVEELAEELDWEALMKMDLAQIEQAVYPLAQEKFKDLVKEARARGETEWACETDTAPTE